MFYDTPRTRRLVSDFEAIKKLKEQSTIIDVQCHGDPPERYTLTFKGKGLLRKHEQAPPELADIHRVEVRLGIDYPRSRPDLQWLTQIYHPNISAVGAVCLGGYTTNWVPSLGLDELCEMLWDMIRYANFDPKSAYNYSAARWSELQTEFSVPLDLRPLRDRVSSTVGDNVIKLEVSGKSAPPKEAPPIQHPPKKEEDILVIDDSTPTPSLPSPSLRSRVPRASQGSEDILIIE